MIYPFWDEPFGYGILMAIIAVLHVFVSHFAIGGGLYLVFTERRAVRVGDTAMLEFLERLSKFFVLITLVFGALSGVGIWFIIGLLNPSATEALIHNFVWGWAIEWTFFVIEITSAIIYYYTWKRLAAREHMIIGWIYFAAAWLSLVVINGIITFMLTPGRWLQTGNFWDGFFNPTYWPSLALRTGVCVMLAGLYALLVAARYKVSDFKEKIVRYTARWGVIGLIITAASELWYWKAIPEAITTTALQVMPTPINAFHQNIWLAVAIGLLLIVFGLLLPRRLPVVVSALLMALGLAWFGAFEMFRESIRKPFIITGYMYGNGAQVALAAKYQKDGFLSQILYKTGDDGADLFRHSCRTCHTLTGYKALKPAFDGTDRAFIAGIVRSTQFLRGNMPPFLGTPAEADKIAAYLDKYIDHRPLGEIYGLQGAALGRKAYDVRCGKCHVVGSTTDKSKSFAGQDADGLSTMLDMLPDLSQNMPPYTGGATERAALIAYLQELGKQVKP
jgi:mono/diheme cytochrome c family protein